MSKLMLTVAAVALALCESGIAQFVPVEWDATCQFSKAREKLPKGAKVAWSFEAAAPLDFNIHYHEGKKVRFPAEKSQVTKVGLRSGMLPSITLGTVNLLL